MKQKIEKERLANLEIRLERADVVRISTGIFISIAAVLSMYGAFILPCNGTIGECAAAWYLRIVASLVLLMAIFLWKIAYDEGALWFRKRVLPMDRSETKMKGSVYHEKYHEGNQGLEVVEEHQRQGTVVMAVCLYDSLTRVHGD